jgi:hypothetical protein
MNKISIKALLAGTVTHYLLNYILLAIPIIYVLIPLKTQEVGFEELGTIFLNAIEATGNLSLLQTLASLASALAAGYVAARIARKNELLNGFLGALPCNAFAMYRLMVRPDGLVAGVDYALIGAAFLCALCGGFLAAALNRACAPQS